MVQVRTCTMLLNRIRQQPQGRGMQTVIERFKYLFCSTRGLVLVAIALVSGVTFLFGTLSANMAALGIKDVIVDFFNMDLVEAEREGRIIILYHSIAVAVVAIETYIITYILPMRKGLRASINATITAGYIFTLIFGLVFAYFGHNYIFHGLYIFGLSLVFFAGLMLAVALWPWQKEYRQADSQYSRTRGGLDLERTAFFVAAVATLGSALYGAIAGSFYGNGFETFLAEDVVREVHRSPLQLAVIGHLHIMLTLIAIMLALIVGRWLDFKGILHKFAMPLMILGTLIVTLGAWAVVPWEHIAHSIISPGSMPAAIAALLLVIFGWRKLIRERIEKQGITRAGLWQKLKALVHDPLKFGALWQMVFMNFVVTIPGIFIAIRLDEIFRTWPFREERIIITGHWHALAGIIATIILLYYADMAGLKGKARRWFGWLVIAGSNLAFGAVTVYSLKRLVVSETAQQPLVDWTMLLADIGMMTVMLVLGIILVWRLVDLFARKGRWAEELGQAGRDGECG